MNPARVWNSSRVCCFAPLGICSVDFFIEEYSSSEESVSEAGVCVSKSCSGLPRGIIVTAALLRSKMARIQSVTFIAASTIAKNELFSEENAILVLYYVFFINE